MEFICCALARSNRHSESAQDVVKLSSATGSIGRYKIHAYKIRPWNESECQYHEWSSYMPWPTSACISNPSESVRNFPLWRVPTETTASIRMKWRDEIKLSAKHSEWNSYAPMLISSCISSLSKLAWKHQWRVPFSSTNSSRTKSQHEKKLSAKRPEWSCCAPLLSLACISNLSKSVRNFDRRQVTFYSENSMRAKLTHVTKLRGKHLKWSSYTP